MGQLAGKFKLQLLALPSALEPHRQVHQHVKEAPDVSLWPVDGDAVSHPDAGEPEIALDNVCAKFFLVYICQCSQNYHDLLYVLFFLCCSTLPFTIIVIISPERGSGVLQSIDH